MSCTCAQSGKTRPQSSNYNPPPVRCFFLFFFSHMRKPHSLVRSALLFSVYRSPRTRPPRCIVTHALPSLSTRSPRKMIWLRMQCTLPSSSSSLYPILLMGRVSSSFSTTSQSHANLSRTMGALLSGVGAGVLGLQALYVSAIHNNSFPSLYCAVPMDVHRFAIQFMQMCSRRHPDV